MTSRASAIVTRLSAYGELAVPFAIWFCIAYSMWHSPLAINHDVSLNLSLAQKILDGQTPYVDFSEINPPLMMYMNIPPVLLGHLFHVNPIIVFNVLTLLLCIWSTLSIRRTLDAFGLPGRGVVVAAWAGLAWLTLASDEFGQREHHFVLAYIPFLLMRAGRWCDRPIPRGRAIAVGLIAGLMTALKPQFVVAAIVPELFWLARQRRARPIKTPECVAAVGVGCAYLLHFVFLRSILTAYIDGLPDLVRGYATFDAPWSMLLDPALVVWPVAACCLALVGRPPDTSDTRDTREPAGAIRISMAVFAASAFAFIYVWPRVIFPYHFEPARHASILVIAFAAVGPIHGSTYRLPRAALAAVAAATLIFAFTVIVHIRATSSELPSRTQRLADYIEAHTKPGESVMWLNCAVPPTYPLLVQIDRRNAFRHSFLAPVLGAFAPRRFLMNLRDDMQRAQPNVLIVTRDCINTDVPALLGQIGAMSDVFGDFKEVDITSWGGSVAPFLLYQRAR